MSKHLIDSRRTRMRRWVYNHVPRWLRKNDFEVFAALLSFVGGLPLLLGQIQSKSLEDSLPEFFVRVWGATLCNGAVLIALGLFMASRKDVRSDSIFWERIEALGLTALAYMSYIYAAVILVASPTTGWLVAMLVLGYGLTCHSREIVIQLKIVDYRAEVGLGVRD